jgi:hypothetical protein
MKITRQTAAVLGACALAAFATACGGSGGSNAGGGSPSATTPATTTPAATPSSSGPASGSAVAEIKANWTKFFASSTPTSARVALLENGSQFQSIIQAQSKSPLASSASAKVVSVGMVSSSQALVKYDILAGGAVALSNQSGVAVLQNGTWKVGVQSFCGLLKLEGLKNLPASCTSAG